MKPFAIVFPGQGSQSVGMLDGWGDHLIVRAAVQEASDSLSQDLGALIGAGSKEELALTTNTQPVMLLAGVVAYRMWLEAGGAKPAAVAGHSLGEYAALVASGVLSLAQATPLVRLRAEAMQEAVPVGTGAMAAVLGLGAELVVAACLEVTAEFGAGSLEVVEAVNFNDPMQTVIAGSKAAVDKACEAVKAKGAKRALILPVSAPFHSSLMRPAADKLQAALAGLTFQMPQIPVLNNVDVLVQNDVATIKDALFRQAYRPVRWVECVQAMNAMGVSDVVECGPGKVLAGLTKRINPDMNGYSVLDSATLTATLEVFKNL